MKIQKIKKWESEHLLYNELMTFSNFEREYIIIEASLNVYNSSIYYTYIYIFIYVEWKYKISRNERNQHFNIRLNL